MHTMITSDAAFICTTRGIVTLFELARDEHKRITHRSRFMTPALAVRKKRIW